MTKEIDPHPAGERDSANEAGEAVDTTRAVIVVMIVTLVSSSPPRAETLTCVTSFQGYRICSGPGGYRSTEWERDGMRFGEDSDGNRWTTSRWRDMETKPVRRPDR
jgi:hypothetical protein